MDLLVTGAWGTAKEHIAELEQMGHRVIFLQQEQDDLPCSYDWAEGIICNGLFLHHPIEKFTNLRYIQLTSAGFDRVPMDYVEAHGIEIHNARGVYSIPMAEYAVAGVLALYKKQQAFAENRKQHKWEKQRDLLELYGKEVCIVGCGSVGTECAKRFRAFGCRVVGVDICVRNDEIFNGMYSMVQLNQLLPRADVLVLTLPLTEKTRHLMDEMRLRLLKNTAVLVNIARGGLVDAAALLDALPHLGGAVLDVFEEEPLPERSPLWTMENVIVTPHNSFAGEGNQERLTKCVMRNL